MGVQVFKDVRPLQQALAAPNTLRIGIQIRLGDTFLRNNNNNKTGALVRCAAQRIWERGETVLSTKTWVMLRPKIYNLCALWWTTLCPSHLRPEPHKTDRVSRAMLLRML